MMDGIHTVRDDGETVEITLYDGFYIHLSREGVSIGRHEETDDPHTHLDWEAADQIARTLMTARNRWTNT